MWQWITRLKSRTPNNKVALFIRPRYDDVTKTVFNWMDEVIEYAKQVGYKTVDLKQGKATRDNVQNILKSLNPKLVVHYGHGRKDALLGQSDEPLIDLTNVELLAGRITYTVSCNTAKELGKEVAKYRRSSFVGFEGNFLLPPSFVPLHDLLPFKDSVNSFVKTLLEGKSVKEAYERSRIVWTVWARRYENEVWSSYFDFVKKLGEMETTFVPEDFEEIHKHIKIAYKFHIQSLIVKMLYAEVYKDKEINELLFHENPYLIAWMTLDEKARNEIKTASKLLEKKKPPLRIEKVWGLEDMFQ